MPYLVRPLLAAPANAVWLLPTPAFRRAALESRGSLWAIAGKTSDPEAALGNLLERDRLFTQRLRQEAATLRLPVIDVDAGLTEADLTRMVTDAFVLEGPSSSLPR